MNDPFYINNGAESTLATAKQKIRNCSMFIGLAMIITWAISELWSIFYLELMKWLGYSSVEAAVLFYDPMIGRLVNLVISVISFTLPFLFVPSGCGVKLSSAAAYTKPNKGSLAPSLLLGVGVCGVANLVTDLLLRLIAGFGIEIPSAGTTPEIPESFFGMAVAFISIVIVAPLVEEFAFRGIILGSLRQHGKGFAIVVSAILFALVHGNIRQIPFALMSGIAIGFVTVKSGSVWVATLIHAVNNGVAFVTSLLAQKLPLMTVSVINAVSLLVLSSCVFLSIFAMKGRSREYFSLEEPTAGPTGAQSAAVFFTGPFVLAYIILIIIRVVSTF